MTLFHLMFILSIANGVLTYSVSISEICAPRFSRVGNSCYFIEGNKKYNWFFAAHLCRMRNAQLLSIENENELNALSDLLTDNGYLDRDNFWTSGNDLASEGAYSWLGTGRQMNFTKWDANEPNNAGGGEHCVHLKIRHGKLIMNDLSCKQEMFHICEHEV